VRLLPRGAAVERKQRGRWVPIAGERYLVTGAIYRVNRSFFFRVDL
jgi:hypothetical protein